MVAQRVERSARVFASLPASGGLVLLLAAVPALALRLTPGSADGVPRTLPSVYAFHLLSGALGAGALSPTQIVIDSGRRGGVVTPGVREAIAGLTTRLRADHEVAALRPLIEPTRRYEELVVIGRHEYGRQASQRFVARLRTTLVPQSRFPRRTEVLAGGGAPQGVEAEMKKLYFDIANGANPSSLAALTKLVPVSQLLFGTDFPFVRMAITVDGFRDYKFQANDVEAINRGNALRLFPRLKK